MEKRAQRKTFLANDGFVASGRRHVEVNIILGDELVPLLRHFVIRKDRVDGTLRNASAAIDALFRVDVELILTLVNAIDGTYVHAGRV